MPVIRITGFEGENRALQPSLLPDTVGVTSRNQKPDRGDFRPWKVPLTVASVPAGRNTIYRMGRDVASDSQYWLSWTGTVHAVRGFDATDTLERTYYSGDGAPKVTTNGTLDGTDPQDNPTVIRPLGVPAPATACAVGSTAGGTGDDETYFYTYTYVTDWGWESAPAPVSSQLDVKADEPILLTGFATVPAGNYNVTKIRIYRTQTGSTSTDFFFLREIAYGTSSVADDRRRLGEVLPTTTWLMPPADLTHLTSLWNGMLAGISGNSVRFCEPYVPYAWPIEYDVVPPDSKPVGLGVFGQSLLVLTTGRPLLVAGSSPDSMDQRPLEIPQGCVSAASIVSMGTGVAWASEDGLCWFGGGGAKVLTAGVMTREDWQALVPSSITGRMYEGRYFGSYNDGSGRKGFIIDPESPRGIYFLDTGYAATHFDELRDQLYVLDGANVKKWDAGATFLTAKFRSKVFRAPKPMAWSAVEVAADTYPVTLRIDALNLPSDKVTALVAARPTVYTAPTATSLRYTVSITERNPVRLPADVLNQDWQLEIESAGAVQSVVLATSINEIAQA